MPRRRSACFRAFVTCKVQTFQEPGFALLLPRQPPCLLLTCSSPLLAMPSFSFAFTDSLPRSHLQHPGRTPIARQRHPGAGSQEEQAATLARRRAGAEPQTWAGGARALGMGQTGARKCPALPCISSCRGQLGPQGKVEDMVRERGQGEGKDSNAGKM